MDAKQFLAEFGHIVNAPGGVARLRELILCLAFKGEICTNSLDLVQPLLEEIELQRKASKVETRKQRLTRQDYENKEIKGLYKIPSNWKWVKISVLGHTWGQKKPEEKFFYIDVSSIDNKAGVLSNKLELLNPASAPSRARKIVKKGSIIYSTVRPYLLNIAIIDRDFDYDPIASTAFAVVHPWRGIEPRYLYLYLRSPYFIKYVESVQIGMAYPAISDEKFYAGVVPLPPSEEQSRIVAKVDELMALCDKLESQQQERRKLQNASRQFTLQAVASAQSPHELKTNWVRLEANFGRLFGESQDIKEFRETILGLAIRGLLTKQLLDDGNAIELVHLFLTSDNYITRQSKQEKIDVNFDIEDSDIPFPLPQNWIWVRLSNVGYVVGGSTPAKSNAAYWNGDIPWVSPKDMKVKNIESSQDKISAKALEKTAVKIIPDGALLFVVRGMILAHSFPVGIAKRELTVNQDMKALCPYLPEMSEFLFILLSGNRQRLLNMVERSTHGTCRLETDRITSCVVGIPPLAEQQRILTVVINPAIK